MGRSGKRDKILKRIGQATHRHSRWDTSGRNDRVASPAYVTVNRIGSKFHPVITRLEIDKAGKVNKEKLADFIQEVR